MTNSAPDSLNRNRRSFSLKQIQAEVIAKLKDLQASLPGGAALSAPAMPTLKLWSKQGLFSDSPSLQDATNLTVEKVLARPGRYRSETQTPGEPILKKVGTTRSEEPHGIDTTRMLFVLEGIKNEITALARKMDEISHIVNSRVSIPLEPDPAVSKASTDDQALFKAVDQLDAIRRHVLLSHDREMQANKQPPVSRQFEGASALDIQRVLARLSNVEELTKRVVQNQESGLEQ